MVVKFEMAKRFLFFVVSFFFIQVTRAQDILKGQVLDYSNNKGIPFVSVGILGKNAGIISDSNGVFRIGVGNNFGKNDFILISAIGYAEKRVSVKDALEMKTFFLNPVSIILPEVMIKDFNKEELIGKLRKGGGYNSGWSGFGNGGEIGNVIAPSGVPFKIEKISFSILNGFDTAWFRFHVRKFKNGEPREELLNQNILRPAMVNRGIMLFDFAEDNIVVTGSDSVYIGLELLRSSIVIKDTQIGRNVFITGHKTGILYYKWYPQSNWLTNKEYELSLQVTVKY
jgi:hypothetical protein